MTLLIRNGTIIDPSQKLKKKSDIVLDRGKIVGLGKIKAKKSWHIVDASGCFVVPGFIDTHVHLCEPGREDKETILTGSEAAAAGGFTSVVCMPDSEPVNDNEAITAFQHNRQYSSDTSHILNFQTLSELSSTPSFFNKSGLRLLVSLIAS